MIITRCDLVEGACIVRSNSLTWGVHVQTPWEDTGEKRMPLCRPSALWRAVIISQVVCDFFILGQLSVNQPTSNCESLARMGHQLSKLNIMP